MVSSMSVDTDPIIDDFISRVLPNDVVIHPVNQPIESVKYSRRTMAVCYYINGRDITDSGRFPEPEHIVLLDMIENLAEGLYHYDESDFITALKWVLNHYASTNNGSLERLEHILSVLRMEKEL